MERAGARFPARWEDGGVLVVEVVGDFDGPAAAELSGLLTRTARTGQRLFVVDFREVDRCSADAVRQFVGAGPETEALPGGFLAVVPGTTARPVLDAEGADRLSGGIHDTVLSALEACRSSAPEAGGAGVLN
ncbi:hypothetical protein ACIRF8_10675 [Streptomyces sp. NPDC102406]|uniref:hypothetical protein n=1 Tax=Streptomyces sp. NPDC102406 TaxID=3366171 RepID=UPI0038125B45